MCQHIIPAVFLLLVQEQATVNSAFQCSVTISSIRAWMPDQQPINFGHLTCASPRLKWSRDRHISINLWNRSRSFLFWLWDLYRRWKAGSRKLRVPWRGLLTLLRSARIVKKRDQKMLHSRGHQPDQGARLLCVLLASVRLLWASSMTLRLRQMMRCIVSSGLRGKGSLQPSARLSCLKKILARWSQILQQTPRLQLCCSSYISREHRVINPPVSALFWIFQHHWNWCVASSKGITSA